jgi:hypothetical protein
MGKILRGSRNGNGPANTHNYIRGKAAGGERGRRIVAYYCGRAWGGSRLPNRFKRAGAVQALLNLFMEQLLLLAFNPNQLRLLIDHR